MAPIVVPYLRPSPTSHHGGWLVRSRVGTKGGRCRSRESRRGGGGGGGGGGVGEREREKGCVFSLIRPTDRPSAKGRRAYYAARFATRTT